MQQATGWHWRHSLAAGVTGSITGFIFMLIGTVVGTGLGVVISYAAPQAFGLVVVLIGLMIGYSFERTCSRVNAHFKSGPMATVRSSLVLGLFAGPIGGGVVGLGFGLAGSGGGPGSLWLGFATYLVPVVLAAAVSLKLLPFQKTGS
jgi:hypothetical protein